jgi:hypothetical protein
MQRAEAPFNDLSKPKLILMWFNEDECTPSVPSVKGKKEQKRTFADFLRTSAVFLEEHRLFLAVA